MFKYINNIVNGLFIGFYVFEVHILIVKFVVQVFCNLVVSKHNIYIYVLTIIDCHAK